MSNPLESVESTPKKFDWRTYANGIESLPQEVTDKLDMLEDMVNEESDDVKDFLTAFERGQYRNPVLSMITYFRGTITPDEMGTLHDAIMKADSELIRRTSARSS